MLNEELRNNNLIKVEKLVDYIRVVYLEKFKFSYDSHDISYVNYDVNYNDFYISFYTKGSVDKIKENINNDINQLIPVLAVYDYMETSLTYLKVYCSIDILDKNSHVIKPFIKSLIGIKKYNL